MKVTINKEHLIWWGLYFMYSYIARFITWQLPLTNFFIVCSFNSLVEVLVFYIFSLHIIPESMASKKYFLFSVKTIAIYLLIVSVNYLISLYVYDLRVLPPLRFTKYYLVIFWTVYMKTILLAVTNVYLKSTLKQSRHQAIINQENHRLEQSIIDTQLNNLKNQINPDFLFRKLDYFYQQSLPHSPSLSKGISLLTDMMKYAINDKEDEGKVSLEKEVKHIQNFIEINQLRFDGRLQVKFDIIGVNETQQIMPLILLTFVENAFKHGELFDVNNPFRITLKVEGNDLSFTTYNRTRRGPKEESEGIGINNTQKRLSLGYAENYSLNIKHEPEFYEVALSLNLDKHHDKLFNY